MSGHVFVARGDLTRFACDAWLIPTDGALHVTKGFRQGPADLWDRLQQVGARPWEAPAVGKAANWRGALAMPVDSIPPRGPRPWLVQTVGPFSDSALLGVRAFLTKAARDRHRFLEKRGPKLLALPVVGTGAGGAADIAGEVLSGLLPVLQAEARRLAVDVALVAYTEEHYAAAQAVRHSSEPESWWREMGDEARMEAIRLGERARVGKLVVFFGAGLGIAVGLPSWSRLLETLATDAGLDESLRKELAQAGPLDFAEVVVRRLKERGGSAGESIRRLFAEHRCYGLSHCALASLPVEEFITTNYDQLFESASQDVDRPVTVLPYAPGARGGRWLLKMHGCVNHPEDVVLTRETYIRYDQRNTALAGIVQAMLITRDMLFLGFSLTDDNFHRIVDAVRRALRPSGKRRRAPFGTAVMPRSARLVDDLWKDEIQGLHVPDGRGVEIFLDRLAFEAARPSYLMDERFRGVLQEADLELRALLEPIARASRGPASRSAAWPLVEELLVRLGSSRGGKPRAPRGATRR